MKKISEILSLNETAETADIYINGIIGYPAAMQFENPENVVSNSNDMKNELKALEKISPNLKKIILHIDSPGGSVNHALAIFTILNNHKAEKFVIYEGNSASAATIIAAVAPKENISIPEYLAILIHEARTEHYGTAKTMETMAEDLKKANRSIATIYANLNGLTVAENLELIAENNGEGRLLTANEALELGFVGSVTKINSKIAAIDVSILGWSEYHINKLNSFYNHLNISNMGIKDLLSKNKSVVNIENPETQETPKEEVKAVGYSGSVTVGDTMLTIENGLIISVEQKQEPVTPEIEDKKDPEIENLIKENESLKLTISNLEKVVNEAKLTVSNPKLPDSEFRDEEIKLQQKNSRQYIYELQNKIREEKLNKLKQE